MQMVLIGTIVLILLLWFLYDRKQQNISKALHVSIQSLESEREAQAHGYDICNQELTTQLVANAALREKVQQAETRLLDLQQQLDDKESALTDARSALMDHVSSITQLETQLAEERKATVEKLALLEDAKAKLGTEFKLLANQIFEEKGKALHEQSRSSLDDVLKPMREQLGDFRKRVDEIHTDDTRERASLNAHLRQLKELNQQMSSDALNLTQALKGESKAQGNWGEMILERILESSGLREGEEFTREQSFSGEDGKRLRPDVVIYMPGDKQVIIDSKVSLTDYERAISAADDESRKKALSAHLRSLKSHIQGLSGKRYDHLPNVHCPDYVLMFMPIEGAYLMAIEADSSIFESAFEQRVAVVTPSTLYATLKLIEQLWRYERQSEDVAKLIDRASKLHDKMADFISAFEDIGQRLDQAQSAYATAHKRIKSGRGNVVTQIHELGKLAGKTKKELPAHLIEDAAIEDQASET